MRQTGRQRLVAIPACVLGVTTICVAASPPPHDQAARASGSDRAPRIIDALDDCVQERFKEVDERLGMARVTRPGAPHLFSPERVRELTIVAELERARMHAVLYLAGREVLQPKPRYHPPIISEETFPYPLRRGFRAGDQAEPIEWGVIAVS